MAPSTLRCRSSTNRHRAGGTPTAFAAAAYIAGAGFVGGIDDWIKVRNARNLGLNKRAKIGGLLVVAIGFGWLAVDWAHVSTDLSFTRFDSLGVALPTGVFIGWAVLLFLGTSNGVNLTDGLDGLAAGSSVFSWAAYTVIAFWAFRHPEVYRVPQALDLALVGDLKADDRPHQYRFAGSRPADHAQNLPAADVEVDAVVDDLLTEAVPDSPNADNDVVAHIQPTCEKNTANTASRTITRKIAWTTAAVVRMPTSSELPSTCMPW